MGFVLKLIVVYLLSYLYVRLWCHRLLPRPFRVRRGILLFTDMATLSLPFVLYSGEQLSPWLVKTLQAIGFCWAAVVACLLPFALISEPAYWILKRTRPDLLPRVGRTIFAVIAMMLALMLVLGLINARSSRIRDLELILPGNGATQNDLNIVAFSDLHAGKLVGRAWVASVVEKVNALSPDAILLVGDILDDRDIERSGIVPELRNLRAPLGVFAVLGNHEYYLDQDWSAKTLQSAGIVVLRDEAVVLDDKLVLAGRRDAAARWVGERRLPLNQILSASPMLPVLLMDHTPRKLEDAADAGVALQLSGHTHNGQLFPFNLIVEMLFEKAWGEFQIGPTKYYVSCGVGVWGPPVRTSSVPEILRIKLRFR